MDKTELIGYTEEMLRRAGENTGVAISGVSGGSKGESDNDNKVQTLPESTDVSINEVCRQKLYECAAEFVEKLSEYPEILDEYIYFLEHGSYLGKACVGHATVIDIMVWQMDHFKAMLDRDRTAYKKNPYKMVLEAFRTMAEYADRPEDLAALMGYETGTDYPGKY